MAFTEVAITAEKVAEAEKAVETEKTVEYGITGKGEAKIALDEKIRNLPSNVSEFGTEKINEYEKGTDIEELKGIQDEPKEESANEGNSNGDVFEENCEQPEESMDSVYENDENQEKADESNIDLSEEQNKPGGVDENRNNPEKKTDELKENPANDLFNNAQLDQNTSEQNENAENIGNSELTIEEKQEIADQAARDYNDKTHPYERAVEKGIDGVQQTENGGVSFAETDKVYTTEDGRKCVVKIKATGSRQKDFDEANKEMGLTEVPEGYVWHHVDDYNVEDGTVTLELVEDSAHNATKPHSGGCAQYDAVNGPSYNPPRKGEQ